MKRCFHGVRTSGTVMTVSHTDIRCPSCRHKLMEITAGAASEPEISVMKPDDGKTYEVTTRCPRCKTYVGVALGRKAI